MSKKNEVSNLPPDERRAEIVRRAYVAWLLLARASQFSHSVLCEATSVQAIQKRLDVDVFVEKLFGYGGGLETLASMPRKTWAKHGLVRRTDKGYEFTAAALAAFAEIREVPALVADVPVPASEAEPEPEFEPEPEPEAEAPLHVDTYQPGDPPAFADTADLAVLLLASDAVTFWRKVPEPAEGDDPWRLYVRQGAPIAPNVIGALQLHGLMSVQAGDDDRSCINPQAIATEAGNVVSAWVAEHFAAARPRPAPDAADEPEHIPVSLAEAALAKAVALFVQNEQARLGYDSVETCEARVADLEAQLAQMRERLGQAQLLRHRASGASGLPRLMGQVREAVVIQQQQREDAAVERIREAIVAEAMTLNKPFTEVAEIVRRRLAESKG